MSEEETPKIESLGWLASKYNLHTHYWYKRSDMTVKLSACWIISTAGMLHPAPELPQCANCKLMIHEGEVVRHLVERS